MTEATHEPLVAAILAGAEVVLESLADVSP